MEIGLTLFPFVLLALVLILANLEVKDRTFYWLTLLALAGLNFLVLVMGLIFVAFGLLESSGFSSELVAAYQSLGRAMLVTGLVAFLPFIPFIRRLLARWLPMNPASVLMTTALVYAIYLVGSGIGQQPLLSNPEVLGDMGGVDVTIGLLWAQALGMILLTFAGVGLFIRRDWRATFERLGLQRLTLKHLGIAVAAVIGLYLFQVAVSLAWQALDPTGFAQINDASNLLLGDVSGSLAGALTIGLAAALGEELIFRGAVLPRFRLLVTSILFTILHSQYGFSPAVGLIFVIALVLGVLRYRTSLTVCILVHFGYNFVSVVVPSLGQ